MKAVYIILGAITFLFTICNIVALPLALWDNDGDIVAGCIALLFMGIPACIFYYDKLNNLK